MNKRRRDCLFVFCAALAVAGLAACGGGSGSPSSSTGTTLASMDSAGVLGNGNSNSPSISADGRYVAFASDASNLVAGDNNADRDVFVRQMRMGAAVRVALSAPSRDPEGTWRRARFPFLSWERRVRTKSRPIGMQAPAGSQDSGK